MLQWKKQQSSYLIKKRGSLKKRTKKKQLM